MKMLVAPVPSDESDLRVSSAEMSHIRSKAAAECKTGIETLETTLEMMWASRSVQVPLPTRGNNKPLKKQAGLYSDFFNAL